MEANYGIKEAIILSESEKAVEDAKYSKTYKPSSKEFQLLHGESKVIRATEKAVLVSTRVLDRAKNTDGFMDVWFPKAVVRTSADGLLASYVFLGSMEEKNPMRTVWTGRTVLSK